MQLEDFKRPEGKSELEDREAAGLWKAIALAKELGEGNEEINLNTILRINRTILEEAMPESAGKVRVIGQDIEPLPCIVPPPGVAVHGLMIEFEKDLIYRVSRIPRHQDCEHKNRYKKWVNHVIDLSAWVQHKIVAIHPFSEANGRTARLMTNIILRRFNFRPTDVKIEGEDKKMYINALCQIDKFGDYKPLQGLILKGSIETLKKERERKRVK